MPWDFALILVVLGILVPWRGAVRIRQLLDQPYLTTADRLAVYASTIAFQWLLVATVLWRCSARGVSAKQLGVAIAHPELTIQITLGLALILVVHQFLSLRRLARLPVERQGLIGQIARKLMPQKRAERVAFLALVMSVAFCEELLYRGFAFVVLSRATGSYLFGALASSVLFSLAHLYQGRTGLAAAFLVGLVFAGVRVKSGSLVPSSVAHLVADLVAGLAAPRLLHISPPARGTPGVAPESNEPREEV